MKKIALLGIATLILCSCVSSNVGKNNPQKSSSENPELIQQGSAVSYLAEAKSYQAKGNRVAAVKSLDKAITLDPNVADYYARRSGILVELNEISLALQDANKALELNPNHAGAAFDRAQILITQGKSAEALIDINNAIKLAPNNPRYLGARCVILVATNQTENGLRDCNAALAINEKIGNAYTSRGQAYLLLNRNAEALADFEAALKTNPNHMRALYGKGLVREKLGDVGGKKDIEQALARLPGAGREFAIVRL